MATWTAEKVNPRIEGNVFIVDVELYKDGKLIETERYETTQPQDQDWPGELVKRRITNLEGVKELPTKIEAGSIDLSDLALS